MHGRTTWSTHVFTFTFILFLLLPDAVAVSAETQSEDRNVEHGSVVGEWRPGGDAEGPALSINEPIYIVVGRDGGVTKSRFQFSFKYRFLDEEGVVARYAPWLGKLHLGYTQTSLWNLSADSRPFEDSSYRPSLFWEFQKQRSGVLPDFLRTGYEHESNGQGGETSRSIDTLFVWPAWETWIAGRHFIFAPKLYIYLDKDEGNRDIEDYRGYADLNVRYGTEDSWLASVLWRHGMENKNAVQLDLSYPIRKRFLARAGGYFYLQAFYGYGQSFLTYNEKENLNVGLGFAIVR